MNINETFQSLERADQDSIILSLQNAAQTFEEYAAAMTRDECFAANLLPAVFIGEYDWPFFKKMAIACEVMAVKLFTATGPTCIAEDVVLMLAVSDATDEEREASEYAFTVSSVMMPHFEGVVNSGTGVLAMYRDDNAEQFAPYGPHLWFEPYGPDSLVVVHYENLDENYYNGGFWPNAA